MAPEIEDLESLEDPQEGEQQEAPQERPAQRQRDPEREKLLAEVKTLRKRVREADAARLASQYGIEVTSDDLSGMDVAKLEKFLQQRNPNAQATEPPSGGATKPTESVPQEEQKAIERLAASAGGTSSNSDPDREVTALQADQKLASGEWSEAQYMRFVNSRYGGKR